MSFFSPLNSQERKLIIVLILITIAWMLILIFGEKGLLSLHRMGMELNEMNEVNERIQEENKRLVKELYLLKNNKKYIEEIARKELGLIREGEIVYQFEKGK